MKLNPKQKTLHDLCIKVIGCAAGIERDEEGNVEQFALEAGRLLEFLMRLSVEPRPQGKKEGAPEFYPEYYWAFVVLLLWKCGGVETISLERLRNFPIDNVPDVIYNHEPGSFTMRLKETPKSDVDIFVPKKKLIKTPKLMRN